MQSHCSPKRTHLHPSLPRPQPTLGKERPFVLVTDKRHMHGRVALGSRGWMRVLLGGCAGWASGEKPGRREGITEEAGGQPQSGAALFPGWPRTERGVLWSIWVPGRQRGTVAPPLSPLPSCGPSVCQTVCHWALRSDGRLCWCLSRFHPATSSKPSHSARSLRLASSFW